MKLTASLSILAILAVFYFSSLNDTTTFNQNSIETHIIA